MRLKWFLILAALIVLLAAAPLISALSAGAIASHFGCRLDEGSIHPCLIGGADYGATLYTFFVLGWLGIATIQLGVMALAALIVLFVISAIMRLLRARRSAAR